MTLSVVGARRRTGEFVTAGALLAGLAAALVLRVVVGADVLTGRPASWTPHGVPGVAGSLTAGLVFAGCLIALCSAFGLRAHRPSRSALLAGVAGAVVLCLPAALGRGGVRLPAGDGFLLWAVVVTVVASTEEMLLRGALYDAIAAKAGGWPAITVGALAFALMHVPLYGWGAVPLDAAVGVWLGVLRAVSGSVTAPATAHVLADWAGYWLR